MTEILFYHLTERTLEQVLPGLVEKSLARDWKVVIQAGSQEHVEAIDALLWTWRDESFLPHGSIRDGTERLQTVWLTTDDDNPNHAKIRFLVNGCGIDDPSDYDRIVYMFDGHDNASVEHARDRWKFHKSQEEHDQTYWQQTANGGWEKKA
ncbi:MAG: DNA polymerase III subunit chi [Pseudomonadota bacterium]